MQGLNKCELLLLFVGFKLFQKQINSDFSEFQAEERRTQDASNEVDKCVVLFWREGRASPETITCQSNNNMSAWVMHDCKNVLACLLYCASLQDGIVQRGVPLRPVSSIVFP